MKFTTKIHFCKDMSPKEEKLDDAHAAVPFTARLMAYYRAQENKREFPLLIDPFAGRLAGDMDSYVKQHKRTAGTGDYPLVRSYYIETELLSPWCESHSRSQIVLLGAGLDTRAYRFVPLQTGKHTVFEIDYPIVNRYKEEMLKDTQPLCALERVSLDLSDQEWATNLIQKGFSQAIPTFWIMEGLAYYLEQDVVTSLLRKMGEMSTPDGQLFTDLAIPVFSDLAYGPFVRHFKWGLDMEDVPFFFSSSGWMVSVSYADDHDQGRDVGQRGLMFVHGTKSTQTESATLYDMVLETASIKMSLDDVVTGIERIVEAYTHDQSVGSSLYLEFIRDVKPTVVKMVESIGDVTSVGQISPRLLRDPLSFDIMADDRTTEEKEAHIVGYLKAIVSLVYCTMKGLEGWQFRGTTLHEESLRTQNEMNVSAITSLIELMRKDLGSKSST